MPAQWHIYGPFPSWDRVAFDTPLAALADDARSLPLDPPEGADSIYIVRHTDDAGRSEAGLNHARFRREADRAIILPAPPAWPSAHGWVPGQRGESFLLTTFFAGRFDELNVARVELLVEAEGGAESIVAAVEVNPGDFFASFDHAPGDASVRYRFRATSHDGCEAHSTRSAWVAMKQTTLSTLVLI